MGDVKQTFKEGLRIHEFVQKCREHFYRHKYNLKRPLGYRIQSAWRKIGSGYYGKAFVHTQYPEYVLKISGPAGWGYGADNGVYHAMLDACEDTTRLDAWPVFARHCAAHPSVHLPKILHYEQASRSMQWAVMPRYSERSYRQEINSKKEVLAIGDYISGAVPYGPAWATPLLQMCDALHFTVDLHNGNIMWDTDNDCFIIIDPFSTTGEAPAITEEAYDALYSGTTTRP